MTHRLWGSVCLGFLSLTASPVLAQSDPPPVRSCRTGHRNWLPGKDSNLD